MYHCVCVCVCVRCGPCDVVRESACVAAVCGEERALPTRHPQRTQRQRQADGQETAHRGGTRVCVCCWEGWLVHSNWRRKGALARPCQGRAGSSGSGPDACCHKGDGSRQSCIKRCRRCVCVCVCVCVC